MESVGLEMDDLFDENRGTIEEDLEEDFGMAAPMPDLEAEEAPMREGGGEDDEDVVSKLRDLSKGAAKRRILKPQPKLDAERLKTSRGIAVLPTLFDNAKFKGKGHEAEDLGLMMRKMEHWAHRLFPKMTFDEVISRMEKLGSKGAVKTLVKRIRMDMPLGDDIINPDGPPTEEEQDNVERGNDEAMDDFDAEEAYDEMIRQEREKRNKNDDENGIEEDDHIDETPVKQSQPTLLPNGLTPEQHERIEMNKRKALERKAAKLGVPVEQLLAQQTPKHQIVSASQVNPISTQKINTPTKTDDGNAPNEPRTEDLKTEEELMDSLLADDDFEDNNADENKTVQTDEKTDEDKGARNNEKADECKMARNDEKSDEDKVARNNEKSDEDKMTRNDEKADEDKMARNDEKDDTTNDVNKDTNEEMESNETNNSESLNLRLSETQNTECVSRDETMEMGQRIDETQTENTESINLRLSETQITEKDSESAKADSESMHLHLSETQSKESSENTDSENVDKTSKEEKANEQAESTESINLRLSESENTATVSDNVEHQNSSAVFNESAIGNSKAMDPNMSVNSSERSLNLRLDSTDTES